MRAGAGSTRTSSAQLLLITNVLLEYRSPLWRLCVENRSEKDRLPPAQHLRDRLFHPASHFLTNGAHHFRIISGLGRVTILNVQRLEELRVPLRRQRNRPHEGPGRRDRKRGPLSVALPPGPIDFLEYRKDLSAADRDERNYRRSMAQCDLDELIAAELRQLVSIAIKQERAANAFRKDPHNLIALQHEVGILLARDNAAQLRVKVEKKRKLDQSRMDQKPDVAANIPDDEVKRHDGIPRHKTSMHANQHRASFTRHVMKILDLDTPVIVVQKL